MSDFDHKVGDTFELTCTVTDPENAGQAVPINGWTITASAKAALDHKLKLTFTVDVLDAANGVFVVWAQTATWKLNQKFKMDITLTKPSGFVFSTKTFIFDTVENY